MVRAYICDICGACCRHQNKYPRRIKITSAKGLIILIKLRQHYCLRCFEKEIKDTINTLIFHSAGFEGRIYQPKEAK